MRDRLNRPLQSLRISVTDRCNLRCSYCMPEKEYLWLPRADLLSFEELGTLADAFIRVGVDRIRITGGEPLLRRDLPDLVAVLNSKPALRDLALTTNGVLLAALARDLRQAGLSRITVSLDTLDPDRFRKLTRQDDLAKVLEGIEAAGRAGFGSVKLDSVIIRGLNEDELVPLLEFSRTARAEVRFIEYMDVGGATQWTAEKVFSRREMLDALAAHYGPIAEIEETSSAPAVRFRLSDGLVFGIIASTTQPFCSTCDRARLTADGLLYLCLYAIQGTDLRTPLRQGAPAEALAGMIEDLWGRRADRGAEERLSLRTRSLFVPSDRLRGDPHLEMHTRGG